MWVGFATIYWLSEQLIGLWIDFSIARLAHEILFRLFILLADAKLESNCGREVLIDTTQVVLKVIAISHPWSLLLKLWREASSRRLTTMKYELVATSRHVLFEQLRLRGVFAGFL